MQTFNLSEHSITALNTHLHQTNMSTDTTRVTHPNGKHNIAVGINKEHQVNIEGNVGYYCGGMNQLAHIHIDGNAGPGLAENMMSGEIIVTGNASQYCGATANGGLLVIYGDVSARCGISMKGVDIVVGGSIGHMSAFMAQSGNLVVCGDAGEYLGDSIYEAKLYVKGSVKSLGADCIEKPMKKIHIKHVQALLDKAGIKEDASQFKRYGSARKLYHFTVDNVQSY